MLKWAFNPALRPTGPPVFKPEEEKFPSPTVSNGLVQKLNNQLSNASEVYNLSMDTLYDAYTTSNRNISKRMSKFGTLPRKTKNKNVTELTTADLLETILQENEENLEMLTNLETEEAEDQIEEQFKFLQNLDSIQDEPSIQNCTDVIYSEDTFFKITGGGSISSDVVDTDTQCTEDTLDSSKKNADETITVRIRNPEDANKNVKDTIDTGLKEPLDTDDSVLNKKEDTIDKCYFCNDCGEMITEKMVTVGLDRYHPLCFKCIICLKPIEGIFYKTEEGGLVCDEDFKKLQELKKEAAAQGNVCDGCKNPLNGKFLKAGENLKFHLDCFRCSNCKENILGTFFEKDDQIYCQLCFEREKAKKCTRCGKPIIQLLNEG
ncbi:uncharacterized protein LOC111704455 [Eurytemora carolleeae]|uniref:uncharacterized protein LOC111704455 n=1 Tax=Eurytemora carolleeae TaxID=1294199 RepID=UPI000C781945|nr:uncharacterized protein LOC111704455 [Eurytemora carolleeae]|eukprot:XP_023332457.1 uncharacterized protein LOC111704455 [Eurytemora affinis]